MEYDDDEDEEPRWDSRDPDTYARNYAKHVSEDRFGEDGAPAARYSLYARMIQRLGVEALKADSIRDRLDADCALSPIADFVYELYDAVSDGKQNPNFWRHQSEIVVKAKKEQLPSISRVDVESAAANYLDLPVRSTLVDRTLVDILLATELIAFANEAVGNGYSGARIRKGSGPLGLLLGRGCSLLLFGAFVAATLGVSWLGWLSEDWAIGITLVIVGLFLLETLWAVVFWPFAWRGQIKHNAKVVELLEIMNRVYAEMNSSGPISARHIRERAQAASTAGVGWPAPLFALLDDVIARTGRL